MENVKIVEEVKQAARTLQLHKTFLRTIYLFHVRGSPHLLHRSQLAKSTVTQRWALPPPPPPPFILRIHMHYTDTYDVTL